MYSAPLGELRNAVAHGGRGLHNMLFAAGKVRGRINAVGQCYQHYPTTCHIPDKVSIEAMAERDSTTPQRAYPFRFYPTTAQKRQLAIGYGHDVFIVDRWASTSKICSACGTAQESMPLKVRQWSCERGAVHGRDINAAKKECFVFRYGGERRNRPACVRIRTGR